MSTIKSPDISFSKQDYDVLSTTQNVDLGAQATTGDGRYFRYVYNNGPTLTPGNIIATAAQSTANNQRLAVAAAGTNTLLVTLTSSVTLTSNALTGGLLTVGANSGKGYTYKIASNTAVGGAAGCVITLEDPLVIGLTSSSTVNVAPSPYYAVIQSPSTVTGTPLGVCISPIAGSNYGWIQTRGMVGVLSDVTAPGVGVPIAASTTTAGSMQVCSGTQVFLGISMQTQTSAEVGMVYLSVE